MGKEQPPKWQKIHIQAENNYFRQDDSAESKKESQQFFNPNRIFLEKNTIQDPEKAKEINLPMDTTLFILR